MNSELAELKARHERLSLLYRVSQVIHSTLEPKKALDLILGQAVRLTRASSGSVVLINPHTGFLEIEAHKGLPPNAASLKLRVGEGITGWVARNGRPARVNNVKMDARYVMIRESVCSEMAVPLWVAGELRGVLNVDSDRLNAFSEDDQELLESLAAEAARVIHHTWLYEQIRHKARLFEALAGISRTLNSTVELNDILSAITREARGLITAKMCSLLLLDATGEWLDLKASDGAGPDYLQKPRLRVDESLVGSVLRRKKPLQVANVLEASHYQNLEVARREGLVSLLSVPLLFGAEAIGVLNIYTGEPHVFSNEEIQILAALAGLSAVAIEKARLYEKIAGLEEQLRQNEKLSALGLLAAEVAHEIRNPLTVLKMLFHSLDLQFPDGDMRAQDVEIIRNKLAQLDRIVEQILDFARTAEPRFEAVDLNRLLDELALLVRHKLAQHNIQLKRISSANLPLVRADAAQLGQVFLNLLLNAVSAMPDGGLLQISLKPLPASRSLPARVQIEFRDTGEGMTPEQQQRAFVSIFNTTRARGSGLGLAIVARIIEAHRGQISVRSRRGHGTTFRIILPAGE